MLHEGEIARRQPHGLELRETPVRVRWDLPPVAVADGHEVVATFAATVRALDEPVERQMLAEAFLGSAVAATTADVVRHFAGPLQAAAADALRALDVEAALSSGGRDALLNRLLAAARATAFGCGLEIVAPAAVDLDSPTFRRARAEIRHRQEEQQRSADQSRRLERSAELYRQFEALRAAAPQLSPGQALARVGGAEQAELLRDLLVASARSSPARELWVVAGTALLRIDASRLDAMPAATELPQTLGPLRSVRKGDGLPEAALLVGARAGVLVVFPGRRDAVTAYDAKVASPHGFNAAAVWNNQLWATHADAGLVCWDLDRPDKPAKVIGAAEANVGTFAPRNLLALDDARLMFTSGSRAMVVRPDGAVAAVEAGRGADLVALVAEAEHVVVVHADGRLCRLGRGDLGLVCQQTRVGRVAAAAALPWLGSVRLLLATEDGPLECLGFDDELVTRYASNYLGLRIAAAAANLVAAVGPDRQRLIVWHAWDGRAPVLDLHVGSLVKHRITDLAFA